MLQRPGIKELEAMRRMREEHLGRKGGSSPVGSKIADAVLPESRVAPCEPSDLPEMVRAHVVEYLTSNKLYFTNERDIQVRLACWLDSRTDSQGNRLYDFVDTEYGVPLSVLASGLSDTEFPVKDEAGRWTAPVSFPWHNNLSIDLVVKKGDRWVALELKYVTRRITVEPDIFGEPTDSTGTLANQATANLGMYAYWKDVRRLEILCRRFANLVGGLSVMVSNSRDCWNRPNDGALYADFSMHEHATKDRPPHMVGGGELRWKAGTADSVADGHPAFTLQGTYPCVWHDSGIDVQTKGGDKFRYMITTLTKTDLV